MSKTKQYWMWEILTEEKAKLLGALADLAAAESWTFDEFTKVARPFFDKERPDERADGPAVLLVDAPTGLFRTLDGVLGFKSEYTRPNGVPEAYVVASGEAWAGCRRVRDPGADQRGAAMTLARIRLDSRLPYADGICFDDTFGMDRRTIAVLRGRGLIWLTRLRIDNPGEENRYPSGYVIAGDAESAQLIADARGLGETVLGRWDCEVPA